MNGSRAGQPFSIRPQCCIFKRSLVLHTSPNEMVELNGGHWNSPSRFTLHVSRFICCWIKERLNMCGIVGFLDKTKNKKTTVGQTLLEMLTALGVRGPDSAGVALYGHPNDGGFVVRVKLGEVPPIPAPSAKFTLERSEGLAASTPALLQGPTAGLEKGERPLPQSWRTVLPLQRRSWRLERAGPGAVPSACARRPKAPGRVRPRAARNGRTSATPYAIRRPSPAVRSAASRIVPFPRPVLRKGTLH